MQYANEEFMEWLQDRMRELDVGIEGMYLTPEAWEQLTYEVGQRYRIELEPVK